MVCRTVAAPLAESAAPTQTTDNLDPGADLFTNDVPHRIQIEISREDLATLRKDSRKFVSARVKQDGKTCAAVGIHLKGSTGSFREVDDKPGFTLSFDRFMPDQRFHGLRKIHLNNSVEDPGYLNEHVGAEAFRAAGLPATRAGYALVELNGRNLGLYVLKEAFNEDFLSRFFKLTNGNLYDPGRGHEITDRLERNSGDGPHDWSDLQSLAAAAQEPDLTKRWQRLGQVLDVERFISFIAMEVILCHRDGYCLSRNNYRLYHDPDTDRFVFLPHGMDQLLGRPDSPWRPHMAGLVAQAILQTSEGQKQYRERIGFLLTNAFNTAVMTNLVTQWAGRLRSALSAGAAREIEREAALLQGRIVGRKADLEKQLAAPELQRLRFENQVARLTSWRVEGVAADGQMERASSPDGKPSLHIRAAPSTAASWRTKVLLDPGRYRFEGMIRTAGVVPPGFGKSRGAGLRVSGRTPPEPYHLTGDSPWTKVAVSFVADASADEIEVVCELRAVKGEAWFDLASLRLVRLE